MGNIFSIQFACDGMFLSCWNCVATKPVHMRKLEVNLEVLSNEISKLKAVKQDVEHKVRLEERQFKRPLAVVLHWLNRVDDTAAEVDELITAGPEEVSKLCLDGRCSKRYKSSLKYSKLVACKLKAVADLLSEGRAFGEVADKPDARVVVERPCEDTVGLEPMLERGWSCLMKDEVGIVGLYGIGGVGKTTLLKKINNKSASECHNFDVVIWVVVSKTFVLEKVQEQVWKQIGFFSDQWSNRTSDEKSVDIFNLLRRKKFMLLLDDIWEPIELVKVGIPTIEKGGSKIVLTSRSAAICSKMGAQEIIKVEPLAWEESWELFQKNVGLKALCSHPDIPSIAKEVAGNCGGLPIAIITTARAMSGKGDVEQWRYARETFGKSALGLQDLEDEMIQDMEDKVYKLLKFSYDCLGGERVKSCFLYCCLFSEDMEIPKEVLISQWFCETFWIDDDTITSGRLRGLNIIATLVAACLLEDAGSYVKMHDVIRDMALWMTSKRDQGQDKFLVQASAQLVKAPELEKWIDVRRISLMGNSIECIAEVPFCPNLSTLILYNNPLKTLAHSFFVSMKALVILDLSWTKLEELPPTISELVSLQFLSLISTEIKELPSELGSLVNLKYLNLYRCRKLLVALGIIFCLPSLQLLVISGCRGIISENSEIYGSSTYGLSADVLRRLEHIRLLGMSLTSQSDITSLLSVRKIWNHINSLLIEVPAVSSIDVSGLAKMEQLEFLTVSHCGELQELRAESLMERTNQAQMLGEPQVAMPMKGCFDGLHFVEVVDCVLLEHLTWIIVAQNLKTLVVSGCCRLKEIVNAGKLANFARQDFNLLSKLEFLRLDNLGMLENVYWKTLPFPSLRTIMVKDCPVLRKLPLVFDNANQRSNLRIFGEKSWWEELEWENDVAKKCFKKSCFKGIGNFTIWGYKSYEHF